MNPQNFNVNNQNQQFQINQKRQKQKTVLVVSLSTSLCILCILATILVMKFLDRPDANQPNQTPVQTSQTITTEENALTTPVDTTETEEPIKQTPIPETTSQHLSEQSIITSARNNLLVPNKSEITYTLGETVYNEARETYYRPVNFYENGVFVAGANVDTKTGELLSNITTYTVPETKTENPASNDVIQTIRGDYYYTQANLDSYKKTIVNGNTVYYDSNAQPVRIDIPANAYNSYTKQYYLENGKVYFAFIFDGTFENRMYFQDDCLIRWVDESGATHDNQRYNPDYINWEKTVLNDIDNLF